jgi:hypothetical protein
MYGGLLGGCSEGGPSKRQSDPGVTYTTPPTSYSNAEGKAAEKVVSLLDKMSFDTTLFAHHLVSSGGNGLRKRILAIAIAVIKTYAIQYEHGLYQDDVAIQAMRLKDTCDQFKM